MTTSTILRDLRDFEDRATWDTFVARFRRPIVSFARNAGLSASDAEDVAQETLTAFAQAYRSGKYDRAKGRLSRWLFGIAYKQVLRERRRDARREVKIAPQTGGTAFWCDVADEQGAGEVWDQEWEQALLRECLGRASQEFEPATFRAFELVVRDDRPAAEAATELGVSVKTIYNSKHRVLKRVRELRAEFEAVE